MILVNLCVLCQPVDNTGQVCRVCGSCHAGGDGLQFVSPVVPGLEFRKSGRFSVEKKILAVLFLLLGFCAGFAQKAETGSAAVPAETAAETETAAAGESGDAYAAENTDPYAFEVFSETRDHARIDLAFNELTGVLRVTYTLQDFSFSEGDAMIAVRDSVSAFARSRGYLKARVYPGDDSISYSEDGRTTYFRRFYILYEKSGF